MIVACNENLHSSVESLTQVVFQSTLEWEVAGEIELVIYWVCISEMLWLTQIAQIGLSRRCYGTRIYTDLHGYILFHTDKMICDNLR